jgi:hypothetical protein
MEAHNPAPDSRGELSRTPRASQLRMGCCRVPSYAYHRTASQWWLAYEHLIRPIYPSSQVAGRTQ